MSRDFRGKKVVVYPQYIDSTKSRREGRRIPREQAVPHPSIEEIVRAAEELGLNPIVEEARYPRTWWETSERVIIDKRGSKLEILKLLASKIREYRSK